MINNEAMIVSSKHKQKRIKNTAVVARRVVTYLVLAFFVVYTLAPFYIVLVTSIMTRYEAASPEFKLWPTEGISFEGYKILLTRVKAGMDIPIFYSGLINTLWQVIPTTVIGLFVSAMAAYAYAKLRFRFKNVFFSTLLVTMMIPGTIMLTPSFLLYDAIYWTRTPFPLVIPGMLGAAACVFFMRQFYMGIPTELIEAAKLDGMGYFSIFWKIMVPLSVPALLAQGILGFIGGYNSYFGPLLYIGSVQEFWPLQLVLQQFYSTTSVNEWPLIMAGSIVTLIPTVSIYIFCQKFFIQGIAATGLKM